jgi:hypothetical protein
MALKNSAIFKGHRKPIIVGWQEAAIKCTVPSGAFGVELFEQFAKAVKDMDDA